LKDRQPRAVLGGSIYVYDWPGMRIVPVARESQ
jgi:hypothetical protein